MKIRNLFKLLMCSTFAIGGALAIAMSSNGEHSQAEATTTDPNAGFLIKAYGARVNKDPSNSFSYTFKLTDGEKILTEKSDSGKTCLNRVKGTGTWPNYTVSEEEFMTNGTLLCEFSSLSLPKYEFTITNTPYLTCTFSYYIKVFYKGVGIYNSSNKDPKDLSGSSIKSITWSGDLTDLIQSTKITLDSSRADNHSECSDISFVAPNGYTAPKVFGNTFDDGISAKATIPAKTGTNFAGYYLLDGYKRFYDSELNPTNEVVNEVVDFEMSLEALFAYSNIDFGGCTTFNLPSDASNQLKYLVYENFYFVGVETVLPTAEMMVRSGYRFIHWEDNNGKVVTFIPANATSSSSFKAVWEDTTYDVNFYSKDVLLPELSFQYEFGETHNFTTLDDTPFEHFEYWKDESGNRKDGIVPSDARDFKLYAYWTARNYNVKLNTNGADSCKELTSYVAGTETDLPGSSDITKKGFNFVGWYDNESLTGTPISFISDTQTGDVEYWAKWSGIEYSVSFVTYTQGEVISAKTFIAGIGIPAKDMPVPTRDGYTFVGWFAKEYDTNVQPSVSDRNYSETGIGINNPDDFTSIILYAKWNLDLSNNGAFRFICYGHLGTKVDSNYNAAVEVKYGDNVILKTFTAKNVSNCTSTKNPESMLLDFTTTFLPSEITFIWEGKSIGRNTHSVVEIYYQSDYQPVSVLEKEKYIISDSNVRCTVNPSDSSSVPHSTITISNQNTTGDISGLSFDVPKGSSMPTLLNKDYLMKDGTIGQYSFVKPSLVDSEGTSLELQGFYDANANNKYFDADLNPVANAKASESMTLYPGFLQNVNYVDGSITTPSTYLAGLNNTITFAPGYTKENAVFNGWSYTKNGEIVTTIDNTKKDELNLYSIWSYYVYFDTDGGSSVDPQLVAQTQTATKPTDPTKEVEGIRYQFLGWYLNADLYDFATPVTESITLKAKWVSYIDVFVTTYMHPEIDPSNPGTGSCITEGWYANAKAAFAELNDAEKTAFTSDIEYAAYYERFVAWARANGEIFDGINIVQITSFNPLINSENSGTVLAIILSMIFISALLAGFVIVRKKKQY
ncbi:MAG: InlB B-repeat-containing protein [Bacilli bacterium]|nr:InlB B-repeat-containing protein [Bacilli bacterium]